jgi:hypothetical protein
LSKHTLPLVFFSPRPLLCRISSCLSEAATPSVGTYLTLVLSLANTVTVLADYLFATGGTTGTAWQIKGVAIAGYTVAFLGKLQFFWVILQIGLTSVSCVASHAGLLLLIERYRHCQAHYVSLHRHHGSSSFGRPHISSGPGRKLQGCIPRYSYTIRIDQCALPDYFLIWRL